MNNVLITGATGFVGRTLCARLLRDCRSLRGTILSSESPTNLIHGIEPAEIETIGPETSWTRVLDGVDTVIHLAARVHIMQETAADPLKEFRATNTEGTINLARQAVSAGVKRLVFMSTIGVNGDNSGKKPYTETDEPHPHNPYSLSKHEAEQALWQISSETGIEVVIIRAPLVYGPGNPGNFLSLLRIVSKGIPLPFDSVENRRSLIYVCNLVDALAYCAFHPAAAGNTYLASDGEDISTPELIRRLAQVLDKPVRLFPFPPSLLHLAGTVTGKSTAVNSLIGSLAVHSDKIRRELGWQPPFTMEAGLRATAEWYKNQV